jgi:hypothetical protein
MAEAFNDNLMGLSDPKFELMSDDDGGLSMEEESQDSDNDKNLPLISNDFEYKGFQGRNELKIKRMNRFSANQTNESIKGPGRMTQVAERPSMMSASVLTEERGSEYSQRRIDGKRLSSHSSASLIEVRENWQFENDSDGGMP